MEFKRYINKFNDYTDIPLSNNNVYLFVDYGYYFQTNLKSFTTKKSVNLGQQKFLSCLEPQPSNLIWNYLIKKNIIF